MSTTKKEGNTPEDWGTKQSADKAKTKYLASIYDETRPENFHAQDVMI